ncbi:MAG: DUF3853 family protein [Bacteroidales bacterium]
MLKTIGEMTEVEFISIIRNAVADEVSKQVTIQRGPKLVKGLKGLADLFGVTVSGAKKLKASGIIDEAISQHGRLIITDADKAIRLFQTRR